MAESAARDGSGILYIVATPIGNLEDMTFRAVEVLRRAGAIACEDTRQTLKLVTRFGLHARLISYYQPREGQRIPLIIGLLREGKDVALVSDAGTPGISDPGFKLIREAIRAGVRVVPVPGPSALRGRAQRVRPGHPPVCFPGISAAEAGEAPPVPRIPAERRRDPDLLSAGQKGG